jgi:hypothetical protein
MKAWHLPLLVAEGILALLVTYCSGETRTQSGSVAGASSATLIVRDDDGRTTHAHMVRPGVQITLDGEPALLGELQVGDKVDVTLAEEDGMSVVRSVAAQSAVNRLNLQTANEANAPTTGPLANVATFE